MKTAWRVMVALLRTAAAVVFCYAGWLKIQSPQAFADSIASFQILPAFLINPLALGLPPFELIIGGLLLSGWKVRTAAFCGLATSTVFLLALAAALIRGLPVECGCFGEVHSSWTLAQRLWMAIARDVVLSGAMWIAYFDASHRGTVIHNHPLQIERSAG